MDDFGPQDVLRVGQARRAALGAFVEPVRTDDDEDSVSRGDVLEDLRQVIGAHGEVVDVLPHAVFAVAQDKNRPFVVQTNGMTITVLGTSFNVKNIEGKTEVIVETGMVEVRKGGEVLRVRAHERVVSEGSDMPMVRGENKDQLYDYYRTHVFECNGIPLWRLVEKLNEVYKVHIVIGNVGLRDKQMTTSFVDESLDGILDIIKQTFPGSKVDSTGKEIILK